MAGPDENSGRLHRQQQALLDLTTHEAVVDGDFEEAVRVITEAAADILDAARVNIWLFDDERTSIRCVDQFDRRSGEHTDGGRLSVSDYPTYFEALRTNRSIAATDAHADPRTEELDEYLAQHDIGALLDATLRTEGEVAGVVCSEHVGSTREWSDHEIEFAADIADIVHRALRNRQSREQREQLAYRESLLAAQQEATPHGTVVIGESGAILSHDDRFRELLDVPEELLATGTDEELFEFLRPRVENPDQLRARLEFLRYDPEGRLEDEIHLDDGRVLTWYSAPVVGDDETYYGRLWTVRDVTERKERQAELERKNRAIENAPIGICLSDPSKSDNPIVYMNERIAELTGYSEGEVLGRNLRFLQGQDTESEQVGELRNAIDETRPTTVELRNYRKDGSQFWNRVSVAPVKDEDGEVSNYVGFQEDVSERREVMRQLKVLHRMLRHDLANQLLVIRGAAEQTRSQAAAAAREPAARVVEKVDQLADRIEKHREIVRLLNARPCPESIEIEAVLDQTVEAIEREFPDAALTVTRDTGGTVESIPVVEQALGELVRNAIVHAETETPTVQLQVDACDGAVEFRISDDGPGLPDAERAILRGDQQIEPLEHGTGMGLWLVYWIVTLSNGRIEIEESDSEGTTVCVTLPRPDGAWNDARA